MIKSLISEWIAWTECKEIRHVLEDEMIYGTAYYIFFKRRRINPLYWFGYRTGIKRIDPRSIIIKRYIDNFYNLSSANRGAEDNCRPMKPVGEIISTITGRVLRKDGHNENSMD